MPAGSRVLRMGGIKGARHIPVGGPVPRPDGTPPLAPILRTWRMERQLIDDAPGLCLGYAGAWTGELWGRGLGELGSVLSRRAG